MPFPLMVPGGTGRYRDFRHAVTSSRRKRAASDPGHTGIAGRLEFFMLWPAWRRVALMGRSDQHLHLHIFGRRFSDDVRRVF
jgi:hypothetical protein